MDKFDIIKKWILFEYNYPYNFIKQVWHDETDMFIMHLQNKFEFICEYDMNKFFVELDKDNQKKLIDWIFENYKG